MVWEAVHRVGKSVVLAAGRPVPEAGGAAIGA